MHVTLLYPGDADYQTDGYDHAWLSALQKEGIQTSIIHGNTRPHADLLQTNGVIPHVLVRDYVSNSPLWQLAAWFESNGVRLLNSTASLALTSDKFATYETWQKRHLKQPATFLLATLQNWPPPQKPMILKPSYCDGGRWIKLVHSLEETKQTVYEWLQHEDQGGEKRGEPLLQEYIPQPRCIRVISGPYHTVTSYEKFTPTQELISHGHHRLVYHPTTELSTLAEAMVKSTGGGLMGIDVLEHDGTLYALEANGPFGFDIHDIGLHAKLAAYVRHYFGS